LRTGKGVPPLPTPAKDRGRGNSKDGDISRGLLDQQVPWAKHRLIAVSRSE